MKTHPLAGQLAPPELLIDVGKLERAYDERQPDVSDPKQLVSFGTSGHRGSPFDGTFTKAHVLAMTQAICDYRRTKGIGGPLFMGKDTHAASGPAQRNALEVLGNNASIGGLKVVAANGWFAARPSGTENIYKIYAESFKDQSHLDAIASEAEETVNNALNASHPRCALAEGRQ